MSDTPDQFRRRLEQPEWAKIPESTRRSLADYYVHRYQPGSGLSVFLCGQLSCIVMVDEKVYTALPTIWRLMHNYAWSGLWGSAEKARAWTSGKTAVPEHWPDPEDAVTRLGIASADV